MTIIHQRPILVVIALSTGLIFAQTAVMAVPAVIIDLSRVWSLNAAEAGWLGGIYFAGYAAGLPFLTGATNRIDGRMVYVISALIAGIASFGFAIFAIDFWSSVVLRFVAGVGFSGIHIVGMKLMVDRLEGPAKARAAGLYSAAYATGTAISYLIAGALSTAFGWEAAFVAAGAGALLSLPFLLTIGDPPDGNEIRSTRWLPDFRIAIKNPEVMRYVIAYAGNTWEVFAIRVWFIPILVFNAGLHSDVASSLSPPLLASISVLISIPVSIACSELAIKFGFGKIISLVSLLSVAVCLIVGWFAAGAYLLILALLLIHSATSFGDAGALNGGVAAVTTPENRAAVLALFSLFGFVSGFLGPVAVGLALDAAGGTNNASAWFWAFVVMAIGSAITVVAMMRQPEPSLVQS